MTLAESLRDLLDHWVQYHPDNNTEALLLRCLVLAEAVDNLPEPAPVSSIEVNARPDDWADYCLAVKTEQLKELIK